MENTSQVEENLSQKEMSFEMFLNWMLWVIFFCIGATLLFSGTQVLIKDELFGLISFTIGGLLLVGLIKEALDYKRKGGFQKLRFIDLIKNITLFLGGIMLFLFISSEIVYPLIKNEEHKFINNENYIERCQLKTLYVFDYIFFHGFFFNTSHEINTAIKNCEIPQQ